MTIVLGQITCYKCRKNADSIITNNSYSYYTPSTGAPHGLDLLQIFTSTVTDNTVPKKTLLLLSHFSRVRFCATP